MEKKVIDREVNLPEFILHSLESVHYVIIESLATGFESFKVASEIYNKKDTDYRFRKYLDRIRSDLFTPEDELNIANSLEALWWEEEKNPNIDPNLIAIAKGEEFELVNKSNLSNHLIVLSDMVAFYYAKATYNLENKLPGQAFINLHEAGIAVGRIYGIQEELRRKNYLEDVGSILEKTLTDIKIKKDFEDRQTKAAVKKADKHPARKDKEYMKNSWLKWPKEVEDPKSILKFVKTMKQECKTAKCNTDTIKRWIKIWNAELEIVAQWEIITKHFSSHKVKTKFIDDMLIKHQKAKITRAKIEALIQPLSLTRGTKTTIVPAE